MYERSIAEQLRHEKVNRILANNSSVGLCISCLEHIHPVDEYVSTIHGLYHIDCLEGRDTDDPNHY